MRTLCRLGLVALLGLFTACNSKNNEVDVTGHSFQDEVQLQENLIFTFSQELSPDTLLGNWDSTRYIRFEPAVAGRFKWDYASELLFSPARGFEPGTAYTATLTDALLRHSRKNFHLADHRVFYFHTPYLQVTGTQVSWNRGRSLFGLEVQADLQFNYDINLTDAAHSIELESGGRRIDFTAVASGTSNAVSLQFSPLNDLDQTTPLTIRVNKGIRVEGSHYTSGTDTLISTIIPSRYNLSVTGVIAEHTGTEGTITVYTSQPMLEDSLKSCISLQPALNFDIQSNDQGFLIISKDFDPKVAYQLTISELAEGLFGGKLKEPYIEQVSFGKLKPAISFVNSKGTYLSSQGYRNLALDIVNVPQVKVTVVKVYENNLEQLFSRDMNEGYGSGGEDENDEDDGGSYQYYNVDGLGDTIFNQQYDTKSLPEENAARVLHLDFKDRIPDFKGIYIITVASTNQYWISQSKILALSDIGLIVRQGKDAVYAFANSIKTAQAMPGVDVSFYSSNNQKLFTATTDDDGVAVFDHIQQKSPGFTVAMVTARKEADFNSLMFSQAAIETSRFDVGGSLNNPTGLQAMLYGERDLYRPGETIYLSAIVRDEHWQTPGEIPVKIKLRMPDGKEFTNIRKILNEQGACEAEIPTLPSSMTGTYTLELYSGNDVLLSSTDISLEEFIPDRIKLNLVLDKTDYAAGGTIKAAGHADNLFGTPANDRNCEYELNIAQETFKAKQFPDYLFSTVKNINFETETLKNKTDDKGNTSGSFQIPENVKDAGMLKGNLMLTVFDETGRPVHRYANFNVYTQDVFYGIRQFDEYVSTRAQLQVPLVATDRIGNALNNVPALITVVKNDWQTVIQKQGDHYKYISQEVGKTVQTSNMNIRGTGTVFYYTPRESGDYEIRVSRPGADSYVTEEFYAWGWGDTQNSSFEVSNEGNVEITTDKETYQMGEPIKALFTTPFDGRLLITLERDRLIKYYYLNTDHKSASLTLNTDADYLPNVYITATLIRPMDNSFMPLTVAHGYKPVGVDDPESHLKVDISAADHSRSNTSQTVTVKTSPGAYVTIAAVDEGILQVKDYQTPDPHAYFYQKQALQVNGYDIYPYLLPEISNISSTGGDETAKQLELRVNPDFVNRVKLVSFWSGIRVADASGTVNFPIDIPQFSGDIRLMALAYTDHKFGSTDRHMKVSDPVVLSTGLPRFMSPKDTVLAQLNLTNTTAYPAQAHISFSCTAPLVIAGPTTADLVLKPGGESRVQFKVYARQMTGAAQVNVSVKALNETFTDVTDMSVRPPASLQHRTGNGSSDEAHPQQFLIGGNFIPASVHGKLVVSKSPIWQLAAHLNYLLQYPYGCVEQTVSAAFPQLYYEDMVSSLGGSGNGENPTYNVQQAIAKLQSMQMSDGALSFWPSEGMGEESWWGSIYAAHFLWEARKAGYEVNSGTLDRLFEYMKYKLQDRQTFIYYYNQTLSKEIAPEEVPYSLFVLALAGQPQFSTMDYYKANPEYLSLDGKYLLSAALQLSGQHDKAAETLPPAFKGEIANTSTGGSFYSYIRDEAISLYALEMTDAPNPQIGLLAKQLADDMSKAEYLNTQESSFGFLALGKLVRTENQNTATAEVRMGSKLLGSTNGKNLTIDIAGGQDNKLSLQVSGNGNYYYFWDASGIPSDGSYKQEDSHLSVRRTYYDSKGHPITDLVFHPNDLIVVKITLSSEYGHPLDNVVVTDMLPAGLEIENQRLSAMPEISWIKDEDQADYTDIRDDRISFFTNLGDSPTHFYYLVRAVSPGTYQLGPVQADAMYDGQYHSYNGSGIIRVLDK